MLRVVEFSKPESAVFNTALDQFLLGKAGQGELTLAFTRWLPSVLVGNSQSLALDVDLPECQRRGVSVMRRLSGGQSVYLDDSYIVFTLAGPRALFPASLDALREQLCRAVLCALEPLGVPAEFFPPDNLIISSQRRTLGNSGQVIKRDAVAVGASLRYDLTHRNLAEMLAVLKTNGKSLTDFFEPAKRALAWLREFTAASQERVKELLVREIAVSYGQKDVRRNNLAAEEVREIRRISVSLAAARLKDKPGYVARGVCYFYLGGICNVPEVARLLPKSPPSTAADSTIT